MIYPCEGMRDGEVCGVTYTQEEAGDPKNLCPRCRRALLATMASEHVGELSELVTAQVQAGVALAQLFGVMILISGKAFHTVVQTIDNPNLLELAARVPFLERNNHDHTLLSVRLA